MLTYLGMAFGIWAGIAMAAPGHNLAGHGGPVETALIWLGAWVIPYGILHAAMFEKLYADDKREKQLKELEADRREDAERLKAMEAGRREDAERLKAMEAGHEMLKADNEELKAARKEDAERLKAMEADVEMLKAELAKRR